MAVLSLLCSACEAHPVRCQVLALACSHTVTHRLLVAAAQLYGAINAGKATTYFNGHDHSMSLGNPAQVTCACCLVRTCSTPHGNAQALTAYLFLANLAANPSGAAMLLSEATLSCATCWRSRVPQDVQSLNLLHSQPCSP